MKPILKTVVILFVAAGIIFPSCTKEHPPFRPAPSSNIKVNLVAPDYGTPYAPDHISGTQLVFNNILWELNPDNNYQVLALDISGLSQAFSTTSLQVILDNTEVYSYWNSWPTGTEVAHQMGYTYNANNKTIHIHMDEYEGWALDPTKEVTVEVRLQ